MATFVRNLILGLRILVAVALNGTGRLEAINGGVWEAAELRAYRWILGTGKSVGPELHKELIEEPERE